MRSINRLFNLVIENDVSKVINIFNNLGNGESDYYELDKVPIFGYQGDLKDVVKKANAIKQSVLNQIIKGSISVGNFHQPLPGCGYPEPYNKIGLEIRKHRSKKND